MTRKNKILWALAVVFVAYMQITKPEPTPAEVAATKAAEEHAKRDEANPAIQRMEAWKRVIYSDDLDDYFVSIGVKEVSTGDRFKAGDQARHALAQVHGGDCWDRSFAVATDTASHHPGSDRQALAQWINKICIFDTATP